MDQKFKAVTYLVGGDQHGIHETLSPNKQISITKVIFRQINFPKILLSYYECEHTNISLTVCPDCA